MRNGEMFGLAVRISLGLLLLREVAGATFFQYEAEQGTKICNESFRKGDAAWWSGHHDRSLQIFRPWCCFQNETCQLCLQDCNREKCSKELPQSNLRSGGIFACKTRMGNSSLGKESPLFSSKDSCTNFNFFIVASPAEQSSEKTHKKPEVGMPSVEKQNFTLSCEFKLREGTTTVAVYWFKETKPSKCLFSATNEGSSNFSDISYDTNCCIDDTFRDRRINSSTIQDVQDGNQNHVAVTITNSTMADSGSYFCVVATYTSNKKYTWTIVHRISVKMTQASSHKLNTDLKIPLAAVVAAALLLMGGIILFLCCRKKAKGKPLECQQRDQTTVDAEDCSPYAVSSRDDLNGQETVYSLATSPGEGPPPAACFSPQSKPAPGAQENVEILYSKFLKDKNGPSLVSDSSI